MDGCRRGSRLSAGDPIRDADGPSAAVLGAAVLVIPEDATAHGNRVGTGLLQSRLDGSHGESSAGWATPDVCAEMKADALAAKRALPGLDRKGRHAVTMVGPTPMPHPDGCASVNVGVSRESFALHR